MNPLLAEFERRAGSATPEEVAALTATYAFAIPTDRALQAIAGHSPGGVLELGAGTGYWARLLGETGVDVIAYDRAPAGSATNNWFSASQPWCEVREGDESVVSEHAGRTLLLVWPTRDETWPADALHRFAAAGGATVVYVGEGPGGRTGDDRFHALLGEIDQCVACAYGARDAMCICGISAAWRHVDGVSLPHWPGRHDALRVYHPLAPRSR